MRKRPTIKQPSANLKLSGRTIVFAPVKYLIPVAEESECLKAKIEAARTASQQMKKDLKEDLISSCLSTSAWSHRYNAHA